MRTWTVPTAVALAVLLLTGPSAVSGHADSGGGCNTLGACEVHVNPPGGGGEGGGRKGGSEKPKYPKCSAFTRGVLALPGIPREALPGVGANWIRITCLGDDGDTRVLWVDPRASAEQIARSLLAEVQLEPIGLGVAPKGATAMALVGLPVWLWVDRPARTTWGPATIAAGGVSLTARVESVVWDLGDGTQLSCGQGTVWHPGTNGGPSPTCGHTYVRQGTYTVRATSHWVARWSGFGQSGTIPVQLSTSRQLQVGELQVIVTRG